MKKEDKIQDLISRPDHLRQGRVHLQITGAFKFTDYPGSYVNVTMLKGELKEGLTCVMVAEEAGDFWRVTYTLRFWIAGEALQAAIDARTLEHRPEWIVFKPLHEDREIGIGETFRGTNVR